ncbi:MAG TPA: hypothetical protein VE988_11050, partial [Gemmataceae bacterium]|nr:hypothetical protein [Gemmataceae bacterium]
MQRKSIYVSAAVAVVAVTVVIWTLTRSAAEQVEVHAVAAVKQDTALPIAQVILFNSGVGYLERQGEINGATKVELTFPTHDINDLLKSLVLQDTAGGRVEAISYDSQDPADKILRSFALDLNNNPSYGQILNQARGEKIEVMRQEKPGANPFKVTGTIIGMESHREIVNNMAVDVEQLNLLTGEGMLNIPLAQVLSVRFQNSNLENDFKRALQVLAGSHDVQKKTVALQFGGNGKRKVKAGYVVERPIWKTTYRLVLEPNGKLFMQGWAIVENTSDDDWNNVRMVLVSGKPISFRMDLYEPLYIPRPLVEPELFASLRPPVYGGTFGGETGGRGDSGPISKTYSVPAGNAESTARMLTDIYKSSSSNRVTALGSTQIMVYAPVADQMEIAALIAKARPQSDVTFVYPLADSEANKIADFILDRTSGVPGAPMVKSDMSKNAIIINGSHEQVEMVKQMIKGLTGEAIPAARGAAASVSQRTIVLDKGGSSKLDYEVMMMRKKVQEGLQNQAKAAGSTIAGLNYKEGVQSIANSEEVGDYYQYIIDQKISLQRQKSAMLPILNQTIEGSKVSIYNEAIHIKFPLLGIRLKNTSGKPLTQGPITVYDDGSYAGDTRTLDLQPNEERLLSYAVDQGTEVKTTIKTHPAPEMTFNIGGDNLTARYTLRQTKTYTIKNRGTHDRTVILEHPIRSDWKLVDPKQPNERSRDVYRFQITVKAGQEVKYDVPEDQARLDPVALIAGGKDVPPHYAIGSGIEIKPEVKAERGKLLALSINKGVLHATYKEIESKTYFIQNQSDLDHSFTVDHVIRKDWKRLAGMGKDQVGPDVYRFKVDVKSKQTAKQEVVEEHVYTDNYVISAMDNDALKKLIVHEAPAAKVKNALQQVLDKMAQLKTLAFELSENKAALKLLAEDQARVR